MTSRELKGYNFENLVDKSINGNNFIRNNVRGVGSDFKHEYYPIEVECKFSHAIIYPSWIIRDWISRFSNNARFKVIVSNRGMKLSNECFRLLKVNRIIHVYFDQLRETIELLIALCSSEGVTSYRTNRSKCVNSCRTKEGCKFKCYSVRNVKDYNLSGFYNVDLAEDYSKFLFSQDVKSKLSKDTMKLLRKIHENNLPIEIIFINNQKEMDAFIESLKRGKDKAEDSSKYNVVKNNITGWWDTETIIKNKRCFGCYRCWSNIKKKCPVGYECYLQRYRNAENLKYKNREEWLKARCK